MPGAPKKGPPGHRVANNLRTGQQLAQGRKRYEPRMRAARTKGLRVDITVAQPRLSAMGLLPSPTWDFCPVPGQRAGDAPTFTTLSVWYSTFEYGGTLSVIQALLPITL